MGLLFGKPTIVCSFFGDQIFFGDMVSRRGAGPTRIPARKATTDSFVSALTQCLLPDTRESARLLSESIAAEDGAQAAADSILSRLPWEMMPISSLCTGVGREVASMEVMNDSHVRGHTSLSEAAVLVAHGLVDKRCLRAIRTQPFFTLGDDIDGSMNVVRTLYCSVARVSSLLAWSAIAV